MSKRECECSNFYTPGKEQVGFCIADECVLNKPKYITQAEAEKVGFELQQKARSTKFFTPSMMVFFILRKFNIRRLEGDLDG